MSIPCRSLSNILLTTTVLLGALASAAAVSAAVSDEQRREIGMLKADLLKAGKLYQAGKFDEAGEAVTDIQKRTEAMSDGADVELAKLLESVYMSLQRAHALLELEGVDLPVLKIPTAQPEKPAPTDPAGGVSYTREVAPILAAKCGSCHVRGSRGEFNLGTFAGLMNGSKGGKVVFAGDAIGSPIVEIIESGDMPRGGGKVSPAELEMLKKWIAEGARFDGGDPNVAVASAAGGEATNAATQVVQATGKETISFASDIAPVLVENCNGCHIGAQRPRGQLNLTNFTGMMRGGETGPIVAPGKPGESLLVQKLKGEVGERMPAGGRPPLSDMVIAKFETWIQEGAKFDGPDAGQELSSVAALARASASTHEELAAERMESAQTSWALGMPGIQHSTAETDNFYLVGNVGEATLADYGRIAETLTPKIAAILKARTDQPLVKGRMTLFFFEQRYDYSEFGKMVERRAIPAEWRGHWRYNIVDAYGAVIPPRRDEYAVEPLVGQQIAGVYLASLGKDVPRWLSEGTARVVASRLKSDDPRVAEWDERLKSVVGRMSSGQDFLEGRLAPEDADVASYSFVTFLMNRTNAKKWDSLLAALHSGKDFTQSFSTIYGGSPKQLADQWWRTAAKSAGRR